MSHLGWLVGCLPGRIVDGVNEFLKASSLRVCQRARGLVTSAAVDIHGCCENVEKRAEGGRGDLAVGTFRSVD